MSRPTPQEWAEVQAKHRFVLDFRGDPLGCRCGAAAETDTEMDAHVAEALAPLIEREREAAREEGKAAVAGPVAVLWAALLPHESGAGAIPTNAVEALARVRAEAWDEGYRRACRDHGGYSSCATGEHGQRYANPYEAARIARTTDALARVRAEAKAEALREAAEVYSITYRKASSEAMAEVYDFLIARATTYEGSRS